MNQWLTLKVITCLCHIQSFTVYFVSLQCASSSLPPLTFPVLLGQLFFILQNLVRLTSHLCYLPPEHPGFPFPWLLAYQRCCNKARQTPAYSNRVYLTVMEVSFWEGSHWTKIKLSAGRTVFLCRGSRGESASLPFPASKDCHIPWLVAPSLQNQQEGFQSSGPGSLTHSSAFPLHF